MNESMVTVHSVGAGSGDDLSVLAKPKLDLQLQTAYQADGSCYYCGVCLVDGPEPDFEVAYLAVFLS